VLGPRDGTIRRADLGDNGIWYRATVGSFATYEQATAFCDNLKAAGGRCMVPRSCWDGPGPGEPPAASLRRGTIAESSEAMKYENKKPETPLDAAQPPPHSADTCKARFHGLASEGLRLATDCAKEVGDAALTAPPSARGL
jgi:hypothetical protein